MIAIFDWSNLIPGIISAIFGGGVVGAFVTLIKARPEAGQIVVTAAQGALIVQTGVIENLQREIVRLNQELADANDEIRILRQQIASLLANQIRHDVEIKDLKK